MKDWMHEPPDDAYLSMVMLAIGLGAPKCCGGMYRGVWSPADEKWRPCCAAIQREAARASMRAPSSRGCEA